MLSHLRGQGTLVAGLTSKFILEKNGCKWVRKWIPATGANRHDLQLYRQRDGNGTTFDGLV